MARSFQETFMRLKILLASESQALRDGGSTDLAANADAKARILLELTQWRNSRDETALTSADAMALMVLLNDNAQLLERHMAAANRVASSLAQHLRNADCDGTYKSGYAQRGYSA
jgi:hypothetical protein